MGDIIMDGRLAFRGHPYPRHGSGDDLSANSSLAAQHDGDWIDVQHGFR